MANSSHSPPSAAANEDSDEEEENDDFSPTPRVLKAVPKGRQVKAYVDFYANKSLRYAEDMNGRPGVWARVTRAEELDGEKRKANIKKLFLLDTGATLTRIPEQWKELLHVDALVDADGRPITKKVNNALGSLERETIRIILTVEDGEDELCSVELTATVQPSPRPNPSWTKERDEQ